MRSRSCRIRPAATLRTTTAVLVLAGSAPALSQVVTFEPSSFPDEQGWTRSTFCTPERSLADGWFHQHVEPPECADPPSGDRDSYTRLITEFDGAPSFFVEWRLRVDGEASEIIWGGPTVLVAGSLGPVTYWFAVARDQVKFVQDAFTVILFVEVAPDTPHTYRLEVIDDQLYLWYIDGQLVHSGTPGGPYPAHTPRLSWQAKSAFLESSADWRYIHYGVIPENAGDFNSDGEVDSYDLYFFQECLLGPGGSWPGCAWADMDSSGGVDCDDWFLFLAAWTDPADPPGIPECAIPPDFDGNGQVGAFDLAILLGSWGPCPEPPANCPADLDGDGNVYAFDLAILLGSWG